MNHKKIKIFVPRDSSSLSMNSNLIAEIISETIRELKINAEVIRNGSRGMLWLEPLVEVDTSSGRVAYGPVSPEDIDSLFKADFINGGKHLLGHGLTNKIPYLERQDRLTFARCGIIDPINLEEYKKYNGIKGLKKALQLEQKEIINIIINSGLRGRGGAGFPTGIKWQTALNAENNQKYVCCNADEGDSGTFADRMLMEGDPFSIIEGMIIAGLAIGANKGFIYIRSEYPNAIHIMQQAIKEARHAGLIGQEKDQSGFYFDIEIRVGAGAYICGEESSMLESIEGKRGEVRAKPPIPAISGLFSRPTIVNNVITLATIPLIISKGAEYYESFGKGKSKGTQPFQLSGDIARGGIVEKSFGVKLKELIEEFGGGTRTKRPIKAIQAGGPLGGYIPATNLDISMEYETLQKSNAMLGHGGIVVFNDTANMAQMARFAMEFCEIESFGKCTPCRIGSIRGKETIEKIIDNNNRKENLNLLEDLCTLMTDGSLCAMGGMTPIPVRSALKFFPEDFNN